ncbi:MAG: hypothetical protein ACKVS9_07715 [Phycisphaerae bacterium]
MNYPRAAVAAFVAVIAFFAIGFLGEGWLFRSHFGPSQRVYRSAEQMQRLMPIGAAALFLALLLLVAIYARWAGARCDVWTGLQFGVSLGVIFVCVHPIPNLLTMNLETKLGLEIAASTFVQWVVIGLVFGLIYRPR